jgi:lysyl-tRNA synthetase class 2
MSIDAIVRITDVHSAPEGSRVVFCIEDRETRCLWEGMTPPRVGDIFVIDPQHPGRDARKIAEAAPGSWVAGNDALRWRQPVSPSSAITRMEILRRRHVLRRVVRDFLDGQGFIEIDTPLLVRGAPPDACIDSFNIEGRYLISSSEYQLKRLVIGGFTRLYSLTKNFRRGDQSRFRNPEFTMLEWQRAGGTMQEIENDAETFTAKALDALKMPPVVSYQGRKIDLKSPWDKVPVADAVERMTGVTMKNFEADSCRKAAEAAGLEIKPAWAENRDFLFSLLMDHLQPGLGEDRPVFLTEWPLFQTTTAAADPNDPTLAQRSELFIGGIEIADGFADLADADLQKKLFNDALALRIREGKEAVALDETYLEAMRLGYPYGAAMALGFDRLAMILTDQNHINSVLAFGWDEL